MYKLENKIVLITGASSGIGAETALLFAKNGANIVITYKDNKIGAEGIAKQIKDLGKKAFIIQVNLNNESEAERIINNTLEEYGGLDILINNAGKYIDGDERDGNYDIWLKSLQQNLISVMNVSKYAAKHFQKINSGIIINISSRYSTQGQYDALAYSASKAGIINITQSYAKLLAPFGRVNSISPGAVNTGYWLRAPKDELKKTISEIPLKKLAETSDIAEMVIFLASDKAKYITGQNIIIDGGFSLK